MITLLLHFIRIMDALRLHEQLGRGRLGNVHWTLHLAELASVSLNPPIGQTIPIMKKRLFGL